MMAFGGSQRKEFMKNLERTGQDLRETLLRSPNIEKTMRNAMKNFEILRTNDKRKVELKMEIIENKLGEGM